jgi:hypothetical protein
MRKIIVENVEYVSVEDILKQIDYMYSEEGNADAVNLAVELSEELREK